ncbi:MAG: dipeptidase [Bacteroidales bacterium]|jgi:membrane dipeptidase|nr:dipeptidase [Bacteroidales bacterium]MDD4057324.1 dipeptidase [Bacteroidales bacterium]
MKQHNLHKNSFVLDSHCDTPIRLLAGVDLNKRGEEGHFDFVRMEEGGLNAAFFAIYTPNTIEPDTATRRAMQMIAKTYDAVEASKGKVSVALDAQDARDNFDSGILSVFMGMENGLPIQTDLSLLRLFYDLGVRYMTLTHSGNNEICDSCATKEKRWNGLSPFGIEVVKEMNRLGMLVDVSHISDDSFKDVIKYSKSPVVATHSCCRAIANHPRNLTDEMIKEIASTGGVVQINFYPPFLNSEYAEKFWPLCDAFEEAEKLWKENPIKYKEDYERAKKEMLALKRPSYREIVDHIDHVVKLVGPKHVGIGTDFDGIEVAPEGVESVDKLSVITDELIERGYSEESIKLILGENFLRLLE